MSIILASTSSFRCALLKNAGIEFETHTPQIEERDVEAPLLQSAATAADIAQVLAEAKAYDVSIKFPQALVIAADQTLSLGNRQFHKPDNMEQARHHLLTMNGKAHQLNSAVCFMRNSEILWRHVSVAHMHMRQISPEFIGRYLAAVGEKALSSVGAYQLEGQGIQLFEKIEGDYFTIIGLPLFPVLEKLRDLGEIDG